MEYSENDQLFNGNFCITCKELSVTGLNIFSEIGKQWKIEKIIQEHLTFLQIKKNECFICSRCWSRIKSFHDFYANIRKTHGFQSEFKCEKNKKNVIDTESQETNLVLCVEPKNKRIIVVPQEDSLIYSIDNNSAILQQSEVVQQIFNLDSDDDDGEYLQNSSNHNYAPHGDDVAVAASQQPVAELQSSIDSNDDNSSQDSIEQKPVPVFSEENVCKQYRSIYGKGKLFYDCHSYSQTVCANGKYYWKCAKSKCLAKIHTLIQNDKHYIIEKMKYHSCISEQIKNEMKTVINNIAKRRLTKSEQTEVIIHNEWKKCSDKLKSHLQSKLVLMEICCADYKAKEITANPYDLSDPAIVLPDIPFTEETLCQTFDYNGQEKLYYQNYSYNNINRVINGAHWWRCRNAFSKLCLGCIYTLKYNGSHYAVHSINNHTCLPEPYQIEIAQFVNNFKSACLNNNEPPEHILDAERKKWSDEILLRIPTRRTLLMMATKEKGGMKSISIDDNSSSDGSDVEIVEDDEERDLVITPVNSAKTYADQQLQHNGYVYKLFSSAIDQKIYKCIGVQHKPECPARIVTSLDNTIYGEGNSHNHEQNPLVLFNVAEKYKNTFTGDKFLQIECDTIRSERILICTTLKTMHLLESTSHMYMATSSLPHINMEGSLYILHGTVRGEVLPLIYAILPNSLRSTYARLLRKIQTLCPKLSASSCTIDFDDDIFHAVREAFGTIKIKGSRLNFAELHDKIVSILPETCIKKYNREIRQLEALAFVPEKDVIATFNTLVSSKFFVENEVILKPLVIYYQNMYIGSFVKETYTRNSPRFPISMWNYYSAELNSLTCINNSIEAWHRSFACTQVTSLDTCLELLQMDQHSTQLKIDELFTFTENKIYTNFDIKLSEIQRTYGDKLGVDYLLDVASHLSLKAISDVNSNIGPRNNYHTNINDDKLKAE